LTLTLIGDDFFEEVQRMTLSGASYIDAVLRWCESKGVDPEVGAELIDKYPVIKARVQMEAEDLCLLRKEGRLPI
jgi:hypothetical protein